MTEKELSVEVGSFMKEKVEESLEQSLGTEVDVNIHDIIIVHDEGDKYRGFVKLEYKYGGTSEVLIRSLRVEYDGNQFSYEILD
jgi:peptidyl-tRNA hydrolase